MTRLACHNTSQKCIKLPLPEQDPFKVKGQRVAKNYLKCM